MKQNRFISIFLLLFISIFTPSYGSESGKSEHFVYFKNTPYELNVYKIIGDKPGKTMLIIGGIQNEPAGYLSSDYFVDIKLERGTLIVVPRANFNTIIRNERGVNGDMNRKFTRDKQGEDYDSRIVEILKNLMAESDILLNLHEGSGFYRDTFITNRKNQLRYGQSIIADADIFTADNDDQAINLKEIALKVIENVNKNIDNKDYRFSFNNHNTFSSKTKHPEQRRSATYYALSNFGIPAFGIESSKDIKDIEIKVKHQVWIINEFMRVFNIIPVVPRIYLEYPELKFIIVSVNNSNSVMIPNKKTLYIKANDKIEISHIEANYERGLSADVLNFGTVNDYKTQLTIAEPTRIIIRKDEIKCGEIFIDVKKNINPGKTEKIDLIKNKFNHLAVEINGVHEVFDNRSSIDMVKGDIIKIIDTSPSSEGSNVNLNFYGYIRDDGFTNRDDRNFKVNTEKDLLAKFSNNGKGKEYDIRVEYEGNIISLFKVKFHKPALEYINLESGSKNYKVLSGETISFKRNEEIKITGLKTNLKANKDIIVNFKGFVGRGNGEDRFLNIKLDNRLLKRYSINNSGNLYEITVSRKRSEFGKVFIKLEQ